MIIYNFNEYYNLIYYSLMIFGLCFFIFGICYIITLKNPYYEKNLGYECGFDPFSNARETFNIKFYLISILFIIFDVEIIFFLPWAICFKQLLILGYLIIFLFSILLLIGFLYEWKKGSLDWD